MYIMNSKYSLYFSIYIYFWWEVKFFRKLNIKVKFPDAAGRLSSSMYESDAEGMIRKVKSNRARNQGGDPERSLSNQGQCHKTHPLKLAFKCYGAGIMSVLFTTNLKHLEPDLTHSWPSVNINRRKKE